MVASTVASKDQQQTLNLMIRMVFSVLLLLIIIIIIILYFTRKRRFKKRGNEETHPVVDDIQDGFIIQADNARLDQQLHTVRQILQMTQTKMILDTPTSLEKKTGLSQLTDNTFKTGDT
ncbi:uncharacterized protein LOC134874415 isoform X3 [Eleginops maclovinus]